MRAVNEIYSIYGATTIDEPQLTPYIQAARKDFLSDSTSEWSSTTGVLLNLGNAQIVTAKPLNNPPFNEFGPYVTIAPFTNNDITINGVKWRCTAFGFDSALLPLWCNV
ncbi:pilus assembly protein [Allofrancisella guangzhouensis]|uniref:Pilus assembly protein n=2 Tax=Allofrancisella guangzhouensis TaxID=594679 RepID=A0A0A8E7M7_9GAMM|nr:pilus assembly protein [Allofrancisella guangzhouensis]MBK2027184.1 pilus assembly protein [Allofrancisella guangzhouensis]MBK2044620.1 pilus assembly protein [Allofrancisella guangzhouensis]MBK2045097.1 pilus assembly protein [Allofrancisella guangzhouensis]